MKKNVLSVLTAVFALTLLISEVNAGFWDWSRPYRGPDEDVITLIVAGNYTKHRVLAELIQIETKQPILLLPATSGGKIFLMPSKNDALEVEDSKFGNFVKFLKPQRILIIADGSPITQGYIDRIDPKQTKIIFDNKNLEMTAEAIGELFDITDLAEDFAKHNKDIESGKFYRPNDAPSSPSAPAPAPAGTEVRPVGEAPSALPPAPPIFVEEKAVVPK